MTTGMIEDNGRIKVSEVQLWPIEKLIPYEKNAKVHTDEQVAEIARSIEETGYDTPIVVDEKGEIIKGHGRRLALIKLGRKFAQVIVKSGMTDTEKAIDRLRDNTISRTGFDEIIMADELARLDAEGVDLTTLGLSGDELSQFLSGVSHDLSDFGNLEGLSDLPTAPEPAPKPAKELTYDPQWQIIIECSGEDEQRRLYERMTAEGFKCKVQTIA